jgi:hypothetical protein
LIKCLTRGFSLTGGRLTRNFYTIGAECGNMKEKNKSSLYYLWLILEAIHQNDIQVQPERQTVESKS